MARMASIVMKQSEEPMLGPVELTVIAVSLIGVAVVIGRIGLCAILSVKSSSPLCMDSFAMPNPVKWPSNFTERLKHYRRKSAVRTVLWSLREEFLP
jgi:hypothetical protein